MKRLLCTAVLFLVVFASKAQSAMDFTFVNQTGEILMGIYVSQSTDEEWGKDLLPSDVIGDGEEVKITFTSNNAGCEWDLKLNQDLTGDNFVTIKNVNLCTLTRLYIYKTRRGTYEYRTEF
ncbi:MAG: hypothetical protein EAZ57_02115 [Cytophagales bacterium]|nr:MAG: hypothetical protein EAZ67_02470 [Cytophagales bacterium]TAF61917.1 MAG: hypothetical protein EAZ57_02115 [Cytophagales bacterium]